MTYRTWRRILSPVLLPLTRACRGVDPNHITLLSLGLAIAAGAALAHALAVAGVALLGLHVVADYLDGAVARASSRMSKLGDFLDHACDRVADVACLGGLALSGWVSPVAALVALGGTQFLAVVNTQIEASTGVRRDPVLSRTDGHVALLAVLATRQLWPALLAWTLLALGPLAFSTGVVRLVQAARILARVPRGEGSKLN
jgi:phosphatidylglycerophosphate synthase